MLWRVRILRNVLFFVNCSESGVCVRVFAFSGCLCDAISSSFGGLIVKALNSNSDPFAIRV